MNAANSPEVRPAVETTNPVEQVVPATDLLREASDVVHAIRIDCLFAPDEYLHEVLVPGGGE
ncbi:MAG TPA: hypothetical protein VEL76_18525 [Gemmataceae bacterium]|nr:hypothetical protein [Gemmataceae bacterium]